jgi:hypothetical protein
MANPAPVGQELRRALAAAVGAGALCMVVAFVGLAAHSMRPTPKQWADLPRLPMPPLNHGEYAYVQDLASVEPWVGDFLFVRMLDGGLRVFYVQRRGGQHHVGWVHAWMAEQRCDRFAPDFGSQRFLCHHAGAEGGIAQPKWDLEGNGMNPAYGPMQRVDGAIEAGYFVVVGFR